MRLSARAILFVLLAAGLIGIGWAAAAAGRWLLAVPAAALGVWMGDLALHDLGVLRYRRRG
jgi:hypothetical protein